MTASNEDQRSDLGVEPVVEHLLLTPEQAAEALGIGRWKLYDLMRRGLLGSVRIGSCRRIPANELSDFIALLKRTQGDWLS
jgi:excisionase family DNA binding protein